MHYGKCYSRLTHFSRIVTKRTKWQVRPAKTQTNLDIRPVWSESSLSAWRKLGPLATHWVHSEDSDQAGRMPRLIWVFAGRIVILLVLSCRGSFVVDCSCSSWTDCYWDLGMKIWAFSKPRVIIFEPRHEKMCLRESPTRQDTNWPAQLQRPAKILK